MKLSLLLLCLGISAVSNANASSWFGSSEPAQPYTTWSASELSSWLQAHNIPLPNKSPTREELKTVVEGNWNTVASWTYDQYSSAQKHFSNLRDSSFETWDESRLREFLLSQGVVAPKSTKEHLVHLAKSQYRAYTNAASSYSSRASSSMYGGTAQQMTQSISSFATQITEGAAHSLDDAKDYVYSTWDDNKLRSYLESKGVEIKEEATKGRSGLLALMKEYYARVTIPVYDAWSDSYLHAWLVSHNIISPTPPSPYSREYLLEKMKDYYYDSKVSVYDSWSDSQLRDWLVKRGIVKADAQLKREKLLKLVQDNYFSAKSTLTDAWSDSQLRDWLVEHNYIDDRNAAQIKRDELVKLWSEKYHSAFTPSYLAWPEARLRAYLRQHNIPENKLPSTRSGLLQETRIRWVQTQSNAEALWAKVKDIVGGVEEGVEERLWRVWSVLKGNHECDCADCPGSNCNCHDGKCAEMKCAAEKKYGQSKEDAKEKYDQAKKHAGEAYDDTIGKAGRKYTEAEKEYEKEKERAYDKILSDQEKAKKAEGEL